MTAWRAFFVAFVALLCALAATSSSAAPQSSSFKEVGVRSGLVPDDYRIGPQDTLDIAVFQVPDLSKTVRVDSGGTILLPLIGQMAASGRTSKQLSDQLASELGKRYMNDPLITVTVKELRDPEKSRSMAPSSSPASTRYPARRP